MEHVGGSPRAFVPNAPAIRNAVYQATGVYVNDAPVNPHHLFRSMKEQHMFEEGGEANV